MTNSTRKIAFILASTNHGALITNRFDYHQASEDHLYGVGYEILETGSFSGAEVSLVLQLLELRRKYFGDGVIALDCGANIGVHTIEWAKRMTDWGKVIAFEAQERIFYALAGNIALNNCFNAEAINCALSDKSGSIRIPAPDYLRPASFGSLELIKRKNTEFIGQEVSYSEEDLVEVAALNIDSIGLARIDLIKIDVEGMELEVLAGGASCILAYHPVLLVESIKVDQEKLMAWLAQRYYIYMQTGLDLLGNP
jgi:FkbM family methyltransferase